MMERRTFLTLEHVGQPTVTFMVAQVVPTSLISRASGSSR